MWNQNLKSLVIHQMQTFVTLPEYHTKNACNILENSKSKPE